MAKNNRWLWFCIPPSLAAVIAISVGIYGAAGDPWALIRSVLRLLVIVPVATILAIGAVLAFDHYTPGDWLNGITGADPKQAGSRLACAFVVAALIIGVFWLCVQGG